MKKIETDIISLDEELNIKRVDLLKEIESRKLEADRFYANTLKEVKLKFAKEKKGKLELLNSEIDSFEKQKADEFKKQKNDFFERFEDKEIAKEIALSLNDTICNKD